jgi:hypothetical protein
MNKIKIPMGKSDRIMFNAEQGVLTNGHWAVNLARTQASPADKEIAGAMLPGKSFVRMGGFIDFDEKPPDCAFINDEAWARVKGEHNPATRTGWGYKLYGEYWIVEYRSGEARAYVNEAYADMMEGIGGTVYIKDKSSMLWVIAPGNDESQADSVSAVVMPMDGPEPYAGEDVTL